MPCGTMAGRKECRRRIRRRRRRWARRRKETDLRSLGGAAAVLGAGLGLLAGSEVVEHALGRLGGQVLL